MTRRKRRALPGNPEQLEDRTLLSMAWPDYFPQPLVDAGNHVLVRFDEAAPEAAREAVMSGIHGHVERSFARGPSLVSLDAGVSVADALRRLRSDPQVLYAEEDRVMEIQETTVNDPWFPEEWGLNYTNDAVDIDAPEAWDVTTGSVGTLVAVLDTGLDYTHPTSISTWS